MLGAFLRRRCANIHMPIWIYGCMLVREEACINILLDSITACYFDTKYCRVTIAATTIMVRKLPWEQKCDFRRNSAVEISLLAVLQFLYSIVHSLWLLPPLVCSFCICFNFLAHLTASEKLSIVVLLFTHTINAHISTYVIYECAILGFPFIPKLIVFFFVLLKFHILH